jgi:hypothetical protein
VNARNAASVKPNTTARADPPAPSTTASAARWQVRGIGFARNPRHPVVERSTPPLNRRISGADRAGAPRPVQSTERDLLVEA